MAYGSMKSMTMRDPYEDAMKSLMPASPTAQTAAPRAPSMAYQSAPASAVPAPAPKAPSLPAKITPANPVQQANSVFDQVFQQKKDPRQDAMWDGLSQEDAEDLNDYINFLYTLPDYKGRHEANQAAIALYARNLKKNAKNNNGALDQHAIAGLGDEYNALNDQLVASLAARGVNGGVLAGAQSNLRGRQNSAIGDLLAALTEQQRRERLERELAQLGLDRQMMQYAIGNNREEQMDPGFFGDLLGVLGGGLGSVIGGIGSGIGASFGRP